MTDSWFSRKRIGQGGQAGLGPGLPRIWQEVADLPTLSRAGIAAHVVAQTVRSVRVAPLTSLVTALTIGIALFLFAAFVLVIENLGSGLRSTQGGLGLSLYLKDDTPAAAVRALHSELQQLAGVEQVEFVDKQAALQAFRRALGDQAVMLEGLDQHNPLPASLEVRMKPGEEVEKMFQMLAGRYAQNPHVEHVQYSEAAVAEIGRLLRTFRLAGIGGVAVMLVVIGFIVANTIQLALYAHRGEVEIMELIGASERHVRAPYLLEGVAQGLLGAATGLLVLYGALQLLRNSLSGSELLQAFLPPLNFLSWPAIGMVIVAGALVGLGGSYFAVTRFSGK